MHNHIKSLHIILTVCTQGVHNQKARTVERQLYGVMCLARYPRPDELPTLLVFLTIDSVSDLQWKSGHMAESLTNMPRHSLYIIIGALCVAFILMLIILIVGICRISRIEYQGSSRPAYEEFYNCRSIDSEFSNAIASIRHARWAVAGAAGGERDRLLSHVHSWDQGYIVHRTLHPQRGFHRINLGSGYY